MAPDRAAALLEDVLGEPRMLADLLDAYGAPGGPLVLLPEIPVSSRIVFTAAYVLRQSPAFIASS